MIDILIFARGAESKLLARWASTSVPRVDEEIVIEELVLTVHRVRWYSGSIVNITVK